MFANVVRLEFTKQRKAFLSVLFLAVIFLFFIFVDSVIHSRNVLEVLRDIIGYFAFLGIAGLLILMGPIAGAQLRLESIRSAEEPLPFSPIKRVFGAYLTSLFYVLIGSIFFLVLATALNSFSTIGLTLSLMTNQRSTHIEVILLLIVQFHLLAFLFAYWINQAIAGAAMAALIIGSEIAILLQIRILRDVFWLSYSESSWLILILCGVILGLIAAMIGLAIIAKRIEMSFRTFFLPGFMVTVATFIGTLFLVSIFCFTSYKFQNQLVPANLSWPNRLIESPKLQPSSAFFYSMSGDLVQVTPERRIVLRNTSFILNPNKNAEIAGYYFDGDSSFFLLKKELGKYEIWKAFGDGRFEHYLSFLSPKVTPEFMFQCDDSTCLYSFAHNESFIVFTRLSSNFPQNQNIEWQRLPIPKGSYGFATIVQHLLNSQVGKFRLALLSDSKNILTRSLRGGKILQWNLPGVAVTGRVSGTTVVPAYEKNGEPYFVIPVSANGKISFVICSPDGSIRPAWNDSSPLSDEVSARKVSGGGIVFLRSVNKSTELRTVGNDGTLFKPIKLFSKEMYWPVPIKIDGTTMWLLLNKNLMKIDLATGKILFDSGPLSDRSEYWNSYLLHPTREGLYFIRDSRICLINWDGKIQELGPASVN